ncbi:ethanolamine utilization protein EutA (predicted chaperonin) [Paraburkholderia sp. UCT70]
MIFSLVPWIHTDVVRIDIGGRTSDCLAFDAGDVLRIYCDAKVSPGAFV